MRAHTHIHMSPCHKISWTLTKDIPLDLVLAQGIFQRRKAPVDASRIDLDVFSFDSSRPHQPFFVYTTRKSLKMKATRLLREDPDSVLPPWWSAFFYSIHSQVHAGLSILRYPWMNNISQHEPNNDVLPRKDIYSMVVAFPGSGSKFQVLPVVRSSNQEPFLDTRHRHSALPGKMDLSLFSTSRLTTCIDSLSLLQHTQQSRPSSHVEVDSLFDRWFFRLGNPLLSSFARYHLRNKSSHCIE